MTAQKRADQTQSQPRGKRGRGIKMGKKRPKPHVLKHPSTPHKAVAWASGRAAGMSVGKTRPKRTIPTASRPPRAKVKGYWKEVHEIFTRIESSVTSKINNRKTGHVGSCATKQRGKC